jgi:hypothetical protein
MSGCNTHVPDRSAQKTALSPAEAPDFPYKILVSPLGGSRKSNAESLHLFTETAAMTIEVGLRIKRVAGIVVHASGELPFNFTYDSPIQDGVFRVFASGPIGNPTLTINEIEGEFQVDSEWRAFSAVNGCIAQETSVKEVCLTNAEGGVTLLFTLDSEPEVSETKETRVSIGNERLEVAKKITGTLRRNFEGGSIKGEREEVALEEKAGVGQVVVGVSFLIPGHTDAYHIEWHDKDGNIQGASLFAPTADGSRYRQTEDFKLPIPGADISLDLVIYRHILDPEDNSAVQVVAYRGRLILEV